MRLTALLVLLAVTACASREPPRTQYVRAAPLSDPPRGTAVVEIPKPLPLPGQLKPVPVAHARAGGRSERANPSDVIEDANRKATSGPDADGYFNAIMTFDYAPGALYQVYAAPLHLTSIQLQPGEKIVGKPAAGDTIRWVMGVARSGAPGGDQQEYLYIKPTRAGLDTTIAINTDRRTYYLELHSYENTYMAAVQWRYPHDELEQLEATAARDEVIGAATTATNINLEAINFSYRVSVEKGKPTWTPVQVFDDGRKTFVRFPASMLTREAPALFVLSSTDETQLVNYRVKNDYYIVDRLIDRVELRVGQKDQEIVRITRDR
jgi:P-type conjugative transfer protein TrbG